MMDHLLDHIGNLNPQLLRELKGRLTWRNVLIVLGLSIVAQVLLFLVFYSQLPTPEDYRYNTYCARIINGVFTPICYDNSAAPFVIDWSRWWQHLGQTLNVGIPFLLMVGGTYFLLSDLQNEERQGTLNFIRLSPRSASSILLGKILGVPILIYVAIASLMPFHLVAALNAGNPLSFVLSFHTMMAAGAYLIFSFTLLFGFFSKSILKRSAQALGVTIGYVLLVACIFVPGYLMWTTETVWRNLLTYLIFPLYSGVDATWVWFGLPLSENTAIAHLFTLLNIVILSAWIWQGLIRCYHQPSATILRKRQSYGLVAYLQLLILGISVTVRYGPDSGTSYALGLTLLPLALNLMIFLTLAAIIVPQRQAVMDWARYRQMQSPRSSVLKDLLFHDQSPISLAMLVNLAIAGVLWWVASRFAVLSIKGYSQPSALLVLLSLTVIGLYAVLLQWIVIQKARKRNFLATIAIALLICVPPAFGWLLSYRGLISVIMRDVIVLASPFLWTVEHATSLVPFSIWTAFLGQLSIIVSMNALMTRQVRQLGQSEMKEQFARLKPNA